ncbi:MAG: DUF6198 family protein [Faecousia sp.]
MRREPVRVHGAVGLVLGVPLGAVGAALMKHGGFGMTPFYSVSLALYETTGVLTMGAWNAIFQVGLILALLLIRRRFAPRYVLSFGVAACSSAILDLANSAAAGLPDSLIWRIFSFAVGFLVLGLGISLLAKCRLPVAPMNLFPRELAEVTHREFRQMKLWFDLGCLALALLIARRPAGMGVGTLAAVLTGPLTGVIIRFLDRHIVFYI